MRKLTIGSTCNVLNGYSFKSNQYVDKGIRIIRIANVQKGYVEDNSPVFYPLDSEGLDNYMLKEDDLLISLTGNVGRVALLSGDMLPAALNQRVACLRLKDNSIHKRFLFHYLNSTSFENKCILESKGIAQKNMSTEWLKKQELPILNYNTQIKVSEILDNIIEIINIKKRQLQEYDQLIKSRFVEMFNSSFRDKKCYRSIDEICNLIDYRGKTPEKSDSGIPLITAKNVKSNKFDIEPREYIPAENYNSVMTRGYPKINDVLFTTEAPLGNVCRIPDVYDKFCVGQRLITMQPKKDILTSEYLEMALLSEEFQEEMWRQSSGSTVKGIRSKLLVKIQVPVPDYDSQIQFSRIVQQVDKLKFEVLKLLGELR